MPEDDAIDELNEILELCRAKHLPDTAEKRATHSLQTTEQILETIEKMEGTSTPRLRNRRLP